VQLIATAHGNTLENLLSSPMLSDLVGGVQVVTLSDEEARRRGTQKTILERKHAPTFDIVIEMIEREKLAIHFDVASAVDALLRGQSPRPEMREEHPDGKISIWVASERTRIPDDGERGDERRHWNEDAQHEVVKIYAYGVSRKNILRVAQKLNISIELVPRWQDADVVLTVRSHLRKGRGDLPTAIERGKPVYALRSNTYSQLERQMRELFSPMLTPEEELAIREAEEAINIALNENRPVELSPCAAHLRRLQHEVAQKYQLISESIGDEPTRRVIIYPNDR
ncbi:MAG TPA: hypothetical protein EYP10_11880, partial [Armatimonadetes bacterium]|nr:hypothetical protein [Armatimonadota bacterium]